MSEVIVPVFNAAPYLQRCLQSLLEHSESHQRYLLIDDASTDPRVTELLAEFCARRTHARMLRNDQNLGFVGTTNRAMDLTDQDVVLLNSDTEVTAGWLQALERCAESDPNIATATPFSNNAEICSLPEFCVNNPMPDGSADWSDAVNRCNSQQYPELPTGVGFCLFIRRRALTELGLFDPCFGRGYGEENDFCRRAANAGWRNVLCDNAFVAHSGGRSFAPVNITPNGENLRILLERHPDYERLVADFIAQDPIRPIREAIVANYQQTL
ncbi:MAG: glycosyltransferase family 2 protein [Lysobacterales bacterium]